MRRVDRGFRLGLGVLALCAQFGRAVAAQEAGAQDTGGISPEVREAFRQRVQAGTVASVVIAVSDGVEQDFFSAGLARVDVEGGGEAVSPDSIYEIGSVSKVFTGMALARMVIDEGLSLDDPIEDFLPTGLKVPHWKGQPIRLVHLSTHASSLPRLPDNLKPADPQNPYADYDADKLYEFLGGHSLRRPIASRAEYSNLAVGLLGHLLSLEAECSYAELIDSRVCSELEMNDTALVLGKKQSRLAHGHLGRMPLPNWDWQALAGAGAVLSTARDMLRFMEANLAAASGAEEGDSLMDSMRLSQEYHADFQGRGIGLGWIFFGEGDDAIRWHNGATGGYKSFVGFRPGGLAVVILGATGVDLDAFGLRLLGESGVPLPPVAATVKVEREQMRALAGVYTLSPGLELRVKEYAGQLFVRLSGQSWFLSTPRSDTVFGVESVGANFEFSKDEQGRLVTMSQGGRKSIAREQ